MDERDARLEEKSDELQTRLAYTSAALARQEETISERSRARFRSIERQRQRDTADSYRPRLLTYRPTFARTLHANPIVTHARP